MVPLEAMFEHVSLVEAPSIAYLEISHLLHEESSLLINVHLPSNHPECGYKLKVQIDCARPPCISQALQVDPLPSTPCPPHQGYLEWLCVGVTSTC